MTDRILAISTGGTPTFIGCDLHHTLLTTSANGIRVAATFLHGERRHDDSRNAKLLTVLFKDMEIWVAGFERAVRALKRRAEGVSDEVLNADVWWLPSTRGLETAHQPVQTTIRTRQGCGLLCSD